MAVFAKRQTDEVVIGRSVPTAISAFVLILFLCSCDFGIPPSLQPAELLFRTVNKKPLRAAFGVVDITPTKRMLASDSFYVAGYKRGRRISGVHDPIWARSIVLEKGDRKVAIVAVDLIGMHHPDVMTLRKMVPEFDYVVLSATHNHEAPDTLGLWGPDVRTGHTEGYLQFVLEKIKASLLETSARTLPVDLRIATANTRDLGLIKDIRKPIVIPEVLTTLEVISTGRTIGTIVHWHCHPEALGPKNTLITSDFPHYVRDELEKLQGHGPVLFLTGAVGGLLAPVTKLNFDGKTTTEGWFEHAEVIGRLVARRAKDSLIASRKLTTETLAVASEVFDIDLNNWQFKIGLLFGILNRPTPSFSKLRTEVALIRLGNLSLQTIPGEIFPELVYGPLDPPEGADYPNATRELPILDELVPGEYRLFLGLAQDEIGYIIPQNGWDEEEPYLGEEWADSYGETMSVGIDAAPTIHAAITRIVEKIKE